MTNEDLFDQLKVLTNAERLAVIEEATRLIREDLQTDNGASDDSKQCNLRVAAEALLGDYVSDADLTAFTALDGEDFRHA